MTRNEAVDYLVSHKEQVVQDANAGNQLAVKAIQSLSLFWGSADADNVINHHMYFTLDVAAYRDSKQTEEPIVFPLPVDSRIKEI